jgi:SAM-dependent methyltransferase
MNDSPITNAFDSLRTSQSSYPGDDSVFDELFRAEDWHFWFTARNEVIAAALHRIVRSLPSGSKVLEIGCGTGNVLRVINKVCNQATVVGMDLFPGGLRYARQRAPGAFLVQGDMYRSPFSIRFDLVGMFDVIEHLADDHCALLQASELLQPGGKFLLTVPAHMGLWSYADEFAGHYRRYERDELSNALTGAGFKIEYLTYYMTGIYPVMWLGRKLASMTHRKQLHPKEMFLAELRPWTVVNAMLRWLLKKEAVFVRSNLVLPFGTSLLAVATKQV